MAKINLKVQGVKGNKAMYNENKGCVTVLLEDENRKETGVIMVDAFSGFGETYQRNTNSIVSIYSSHGIPVFTGTFKNLLEKLTT